MTMHTYNLANRVLFNLLKLSYNHQHIYTYDLENKVIIENSNRDYYKESEFDNLNKCRIGQALLQFINYDFTYYDYQRQNVLDLIENFHSPPPSKLGSLDDAVIKLFPDIAEAIFLYEKWTGKFFIEALILSIMLLVSFHIPYALIDVHKLYGAMNGEYDLIYQQEYDYLSLHQTFMERFVPCLDVAVCPTFQDSLKKYISLSNLIYHTNNTMSFKEITIVRHLITEPDIEQLRPKLDIDSWDFLTTASGEEIAAAKQVQLRYDALMNHKISSSGTEIVHGYSFETMQESLMCEFLKMLELNIKIKKCAICGKYFILNGHDGECCDNLYKDTGLTCQQVYADRNYKNKRKKNPILKEYDKCYKRMYARYSSRKNLSSEKYNSWKEEAARERDKALAAYAANPSDTIIEDFKKFLGNK